nr:unnamed protein product [Callosobruchus analis]
MKKRPLSVRIEENLDKLVDLIKVLFSLSYLKYLAISCFVDFGLMASYEKYQHDSPEVGVCVVSANKDTTTNIFEEFLKTFRKCDPSIDNRVFIETVIIGCMISLVLSGTATLLLNWVRNSTETIILSCIFEALASLMEAVIFCVVVDSFPTNVRYHLIVIVLIPRAIALAITATFGRLGAIFGNVIFGVLIDVNCVIPIYVFATLQIATFEDAIAATGLGRYNFLLMVVSFFPTVSQTFESSSLSYVLPMAQCDLDLTLEDFGVIMSMTYVGMVSSGFFWGCLSDTYGRKKVLVYGYLLNALFATLGAFSTSSTILMVSKVCGGLVISGPFSAAIVHTSEFYCKEYRNKAKLIRSTLSSLANIILPLTAWLILPNKWNFVIAGYEFRSWNLFLLLCAMVPLIGGICYAFMPESPRYLMSSGNNRKALKVFQKVYTINTGKPKDTFPHPCLVMEGNGTQNAEMKRTASELMIKGLKELKVLLHKPYMSRIILACTASFSICISNMTLSRKDPKKDGQKSLIAEADIEIIDEALQDIGRKCLLEKEIYTKPADFETAILASDYGKFNLILYIISVTAGWSSIFETTTMSYVFPAAECDLELSLAHKGWLNAITYAGMISSAFVWGYLSDTLGRKKLLVVGYLLDALLVTISAFSQNFYVLITTKFLGGLIINGPFAALTSYLSEFHCAKHRARVQMIVGFIFSIGNLLLPILALAIFPIKINLQLGDWVFHSWNVYLLICSLPPLISGVAFMFLPESPKFLMTVGKNDKALKIFRHVYHLNTGKLEETYPITELVEENRNSRDNTNTKDPTGRFGLNTLRLWLPQLYQAINDYQYYSTSNKTTLCDMLEVFQKHNESKSSSPCEVNMDNSQVYTNSMIVAGVSIVGYIVAGGLINIVGKKKLLSCGILACFVPNTDMKALE